MAFCACITSSAAWESVVMLPPCSRRAEWSWLVEKMVFFFANRWRGLEGVFPCLSALSHSIRVNCSNIWPYQVPKREPGRPYLLYWQLHQSKLRQLRPNGLTVDARRLTCIGNAELCKSLDTHSVPYRFCSIYSCSNVALANQYNNHFTFLKVTFWLLFWMTLCQ